MGDIFIHILIFFAVMYGTRPPFRASSLRGPMSPCAVIARPRKGPKQSPSPHGLSLRASALPLLCHCEGHGSGPWQSRSSVSKGFVIARGCFLAPWQFLFWRSLIFVRTVFRYQRLLRQGKRRPSSQ